LTNVPYAVGMRSRVWFPVTALLAASGWCVLLLVARRHAFGAAQYRDLVWNLMLAWVPLVLAVLLYAAYRRRHTLVELAAIGIAWLIFLPNAPYVLTDFVHLGQSHRLFDTMIIASFAGTALAVGFASLLLVQIVVTRIAGVIAGWGVVISALFLSSIGMYLGRVQRFNSWDVVRRPRLVAWTVRERLDDPFGNRYLLLFVAAACGFLTLAYVALYGIATLASLAGRRPEAPVLLSKESWPSRSSSSNRS
jgi:uncharacterized membrane protein